MAGGAGRGKCKCEREARLQDTPDCLSWRFGRLFFLRNVITELNPRVGSLLLPAARIDHTRAGVDSYRVLFSRVVPGDYHSLTESKPLYPRNTRLNITVLPAGIGQNLFAALKMYGIAEKSILKSSI